MFSSDSHQHTAPNYTDGHRKKTELKKPVWEKKRLGLRTRTLGLESPSCVVLSKKLNFSRFTFFTCQTKVLNQLILEGPSSSDILWSRVFRRTSSWLGDFSIALLLLTKYIKHLDSCWAVRSWDAGTLPTVESNFQRCSCIKHPNAQKLGKGVVYIYTRQSLSKQDELSCSEGPIVCYGCNSKENLLWPLE